MTVSIGRVKISAVAAERREKERERVGKEKKEREARGAYKP